MENKRALLTLFGGRAFLPIALLVLHEKPALVVPISSEQSQRHLPQLQQAIRKFQTGSEIQSRFEAPKHIDAFEVQEIQDLCEKVIAQYPDMERVGDIESGASLMSLGGYIGGKKCSEEKVASIKCWYLNTARARAIPLIGEPQDDSIFHISVDDYATAYGRTLKAGELASIQSSKKAEWLSFARRLGKDSTYNSLLKVVMNEIKDRPAINTPKLYELSGLSDEVYKLLEDAQKAGLISALSRNADLKICFKLSYLQNKFLNGGWLEAYVWDEARSLTDETNETRFFDDCQWNQLVEGDIDNELDVAATYKAQLIVAECKTGDNAFAVNTLYKWDSVSEYFGGKFVGKLLITNLLPPKEAARGLYKSHLDFLARAHSKGIVVVTGEALPDIGAILKQEAIDATYPRI